MKISAIDIGLACYNELHMDINMSSVFVQLRQVIMTVCQEGQTVLPPALNQKEYPSFKKFKTQKEEAVLKWQVNEKKIMNFSASVSSLSQSPGKKRKPENTSKLMYWRSW